MKFRLTDIIVPTICAILATWMLVQWIETPLDRVAKIHIREPGMDAPSDEQAAKMKANADLALVVGEPVFGDGVASSLGGEWPCFRGPNLDAISMEPIKLKKSWPESGPPKLWEIELCPGYAGAAISKGRVFVLDYDEDEERDVIRCLSLDDGKTIWTNGYSVELVYSHGFTRTVPTIIDNFVITLGPRCHVACWDLETGENLWIKSMVDDFGAKLPQWYTGQNPLIHNGRLIIAPCGESMLMALDYKTGEVIWKSPNPLNWNMTHCSVVPMEFEGREMYLYLGGGGIAGIDANDGTLLWDSKCWPEVFATAPSPVVLPGGKIFLCSGYKKKVGSLFLQLKLNGDKIEAEVLKEMTPKEFNSEQQTPIVRGDFVFGAHKRNRGQMVCLDSNGNQIWNSGANQYNDGPFMFVGDLLLGMDDHGLLMLAEATTKSYKPLAQFKVFPGGAESWGPMAFADGRLIVRDASRMACLKLD